MLGEGAAETAPGAGDQGDLASEPVGHFRRKSAGGGSRGPIHSGRNNVKWRLAVCRK